ncbi:MAG: hypothetical protein IJP68_13435 [Selenomonadaceae bacterium]|nr:hypothetical protein [Selenomonadaceae bacterium]
MGLLGDVVGGVFKIGVGIVGAGIDAIIQGTKEANNVRNNARGMSDQELLNGYMNKNNSWGARAGYGAAFKDRHRR